MNLLAIVKNSVTTNRHFSFDSESRLYWLKIVISLGLISGLLLSLKLWAGARFYPLLPVLDILPPIPNPIDWMILLTILSLLTATIFSSKPNRFIWATLALVSLLVFLDQTRLQPWVYEYSFILFGLAFFSWNVQDTVERNALLDSFRIVIAFHFFWAGIQKINPVFLLDTFPWMISPIAQLFPESTTPLFHSFGLLVPFIEAGIGVGLLTQRFRKKAILAALLLGVFVLWTIGPFGHNWNSVIWPWNIVVPLLAVILFAKTPDVSFFEILQPKNSRMKLAALVMFGVLPFFSLFNAWDSFLSFALYSGNLNQASIFMSENVQARLPEHLRGLVQPDTDGRYFLLVSNWALAELNAPPYPEIRTHKRVLRSICAFADNPLDVTLSMSGRLSWFNRDGRQMFNCPQLH